MLRIWEEKVTDTAWEVMDTGWDVTDIGWEYHGYWCYEFVGGMSGHGGRIKGFRGSVA